MGRSPLEWLCFFIAVVRRGSSLLRTFYISYAQDILASVYDRFTKGFCRCGHVCRCSLYVIALVGGIERTKLQIGAHPDKRRNARAG